jgi:hypothetical protein
MTTNDALVNITGIMDPCPPISLITRLTPPHLGLERGDGCTPQESFWKLLTHHIHRFIVGFETYNISNPVESIKWST